MSAKNDMKRLAAALESFVGIQLTSMAGGNIPFRECTVCGFSLVLSEKCTACKAECPRPKIQVPGVVK